MSQMPIRVPVRPSPARQCTASRPFCFAAMSRKRDTIASDGVVQSWHCLLYTSPSPRDRG
eukprot:53216-Rhodomonas_salina.2